MGTWGRGFDGSRRACAPALVALAALVGAAGCGALDGETGTTLPPIPDDDADSSTTATTGGTELLGDDYERGDCVIWDADPGGESFTDVVPCEEPHRFQVVEAAESPETADDAYPTPEQWLEHRDTVCRPAAEDFIGGSFDPYGRLTPTYIGPTEESWEAGRTGMWCGIGSTAPPDGGDPALFTGDAREIDQAWSWAPGTCVAQPPIVAGVTEVPCTEPHQQEVVARLDVSHLAAPPTDADMPALWEQCEEHVRGYLGGDPTPPWEMAVENLGQESWVAGTRAVHCYLGQFGPDGKHMEVTAPVPR